MKRARSLVVLAVLACGSGPHAPSFKLQLATPGSSAADGSSPTIEMRAGDARLVEFVVVGSVSEPVTFCDRWCADVRVAGRTHLDARAAASRRA